MNVEHDAVFGCELAQGRADKDGYVFWGRSRAHKVAWESQYGQVPDGMELEHTCRRRACCALHHLELVTRRENELRKSLAYRLRKTVCQRGHHLSENRVVTPEGGVVCRRCNREAQGETR